MLCGVTPFQLSLYTVCAGHATVLVKQGPSSAVTGSLKAITGVRVVSKKSVADIGHGPIRKPDRRPTSGGLYEQDLEGPNFF